MMRRAVSAALAVTAVMGLALTPIGSAATAGATTPTAPAQGYIVSFSDTVTDPGATAHAQVAATGGTVTRVFRRSTRGYVATFTPGQAAAIAADPRVVSVEPDLQLHAADVQPPQHITHSVQRVAGDQSSTVSGDGTGSVNVNVAVIDEGVDGSHPDLNRVGGADCSPHPETPIGWHGTMVAGYLAARDNGIGVVGVAPGARVWDVRVLSNRGSGLASNVICGLDWVTSTRQDADPNNDIAVANMSLTGPFPHTSTCTPRNGDAVHRAVCRATAAGVSVVVAAGNSGQDLTKERPASYPEVLSATALTDLDGSPGGLGAESADCHGAAPPDNLVDDRAASFSNYATTAQDLAHIVAAPGVCAESTYPGAQYASGSGTSFASPVVAGVVALCIADGACAGLDPAQIVTKVIHDAAIYSFWNRSYGFTGDPFHPIPGKRYGYLVRAGIY